MIQMIYSQKSQISQKHFQVFTFSFLSLSKKNLYCQFYNYLVSLSFKENVPELLESDHRVPVDVCLHHHLLEVVIGEAYPQPRQDKLDLRGRNVAIAVLKCDLIISRRTQRSLFTLSKTLNTCLRSSSVSFSFSLFTIRLTNSKKSTVPEPSLSAS